MKSKTLREDRTAAERKSAAVATRRRRRILHAGFFFIYAIKKCIDKIPNKEYSTL